MDPFIADVTFESIMIFSNRFFTYSTWTLDDHPGDGNKNSENNRS
jgi:hypothetical protein